MQKGFNISYPYLTNELIDLGLNHTRYWPESVYPKNALKHLLSRKISSKLVHRKKQGFLGPVLEKFSHSVYLNHFDKTLATDAPLAGILNHDIMQKMREFLVSKKELPLQTYNFLWAVTFTNSWLNQLREGT
jgi:hypothetical protein